MKVVVFALHSGMWDHAFPEAVIAESLAKQGHDITYVTCNQTLSGFCTVMTAYGLSDRANHTEKTRVCQACVRCAYLIVKQFKFKNYSINSKLSETDNIQAQKLLSKLSQENLIDFEIEGIFIGKITLYQMLLEYKKNSINFNENEWDRVVIELNNSIKTFFAGKRIIEDEKPDAVIVYNSLYSVNHIFCKLCEKWGIKTYFLHAGGNLATRLETMILASNDGFQYYRELIKKWHEFKNIPCSEKLIASVKGHLLSVMQASTLFSYSVSVKENNINIRDYFSIPKHKKVILAAMSSNDERYAAELVGVFKQPNNLLFPDQNQWLTSVIQYVKNREDLFLIIRVHPREFANRRESVISENYHELKKILDNLPSNVKVNWPSDQISLYQLAHDIELCLNSWSSAGKELSALGIPVLIYSKELQVYPHDINYVGETEFEYYAMFEKALDDGWSFELIRKAFRWYAFEYFITTLNISDSYKDRSPNFIYRVANRLLRMIHQDLPKRIDCIKRADQLKEGQRLYEIVAHKNGSILDILSTDSFDNVDIVEETKHLKNHLKDIFKVINNNNIESRLLNNASSVFEIS